MQIIQYVYRIWGIMTFVAELKIDNLQVQSRDGWGPNEGRVLQFLKINTPA